MHRGQGTSFLMRLQVLAFFVLFRPQGLVYSSGLRCHQFKGVFLKLVVQGEKIPENPIIQVQSYTTTNRNKSNECI